MLAEKLELDREKLAANYPLDNVIGLSFAVSQNGLFLRQIFWCLSKDCDRNEES
jgi:hypothetical protein